MASGTLGAMIDGNGGTGGGDWFSANAPGGSYTANTPTPYATGGITGAAGTSSDPGLGGNITDPSQWMALAQNRPALTNWIQQQNPGWPPDLVNYYADTIQKQPGANPTEQAGSAAYYQNKFKADPFYGGAQGGQGGNGYTFSTDDPSYAWRFGQGLDAVQKSAAARGTLLTGGTLKAITNYGQDAASQEYQNAFGRKYSLANLGLNAANIGAQSGSSYANQAGNLATGQGNANAAANIAQGNTLGGLVGNLAGLGANTYSQWNAQRKPPTASPYGPYAGGYQFPSGQGGNA